MASHPETPSRILRRIEQDEALADDMPSLPSLPGYDDSAIEHPSSFSLEPSTQSNTVQRIIRQQSPSTTILARSNGNTTSNLTPRAGALGSTLEQGLVYSQPPPVDDGILESQPSLPTLPSLPNITLDTADNRTASSSLHDLEYSRNGTSFSRSFAARDFKDVAIRKPKPHEPCPPVSSHTPSNISSSVGSLPKSSFSPFIDDISRPSAENLTSLEPGVINTRDSEENFEGQSSASLRTMTPRTREEQSSVRDLLSQEPTFSSEGVNMTHIPAFRDVHIPPTLDSFSMNSTPMPVYQGRAEGRGHAEDTKNYQGPHQEEMDDLATPLPRRKSFLLSVVNSTARPRMAFPTPHPRCPPPAAIDIANGLTPGPSRVHKSEKRRARLSYPLSRTFSPATPYQVPPFEHEEPNPEGLASASFISTASSHDLTVHHRANASFDPVTGPQGVGRFNAGKLNTYLHGLNRRLQEENEVLVQRIRSQQSELEAFHDHVDRKELSGVAEDEAAEQWVLEKEDLEQRIEGLQEQIVAKESDLEAERAERLRDKERWKERMTEVEDGVGQIISDLEKRVATAEKKAAELNDVEIRLQDAQNDLNGVRSECQLLKHRAAQAEQIMANEKEAGSTLLIANDTNEELKRDVQALTLQLREKETAYSTAQILVDDLKKENFTLKDTVRNLESSLRFSMESKESAQEDAKDSRKEQSKLNEELLQARMVAKRLQEESKLAIDKAKNFEKQLIEAESRLVDNQEALQTANEQVAISSDDVNKLRVASRQLEDALEESDRKIISDGKELLELRSKMAILGREQEKIRSLSQSQINLKTLNEIDYGVLETELAEATKEIGRLSALLNQSPARKAIEKARDSRIELLERENEDLINQLRAARDSSRYATPRKNSSMSGISPMYRQLINLSMKAPRTPGEPLRNASWLMDVTGDISTAHLMEEIYRLQKELDTANESIDDKLDKLEEAGFGVVELTKALEDARKRITNLEASLARSEERESRSYNPHICSKCERPDIAGSSKDPNVSLQVRLGVVTAELESLRKRRDEELASSFGEKAVLRDTANRLNMEIRRAQEELREAQKRDHTAEKTKLELQQDLTKARQAIDDLEYHLHSERSRLRAVNSENVTASKEKENILRKLRETEQKMDEAKDRVLQLKEANIILEAELRVERKTSDIEDKLLVNRETMDQLRQERVRLSDNHFDLQQRLAEASKHVNELTTKHASLQISYDGRRRQIDEQAREIESLRAAFSSQAEELYQARSEKKHSLSGGGDIFHVASKLESELKRIQQHADGFGRDLLQLRSEREKLLAHHQGELQQHERVNKQIHSQMRLLKEQLAVRKNSMPDINTIIENLRLKHNNECKGLFVHIRYLQAMCTRETSFRDQLGQQKGFLLTILSRYEKSEKRVLATIALIDPVTSLKKGSKVKSLKAVVLAIIFISRARQASETWREQKAVRPAIVAALEAVRKRRVLKSCD